MNEQSAASAVGAVIIGAGPAGLTAAYELIERAGINPTILEMSEHLGGIARTVNYKGNRIDIGGHRFFSRSDRVMEWWLRFLPLEKAAGAAAHIAYHRTERTVMADAGLAPDPAVDDRVMLLRNRVSRIMFVRRFFAYPLSLSAATVVNLGLFRTLRALGSYLRAHIAPIRPENTLEDFFINRFGRFLYEAFFRSYTEKVWGVPCREISADWGAQRVKGLSIFRAASHMLMALLPPRLARRFRNKSETSLIEKFLYPKFGPGQMWEEVARQVEAGGGHILTGWIVDRIEHEDHRRVIAVEARHTATGERRRVQGNWFFSTMPVRELIAALDPPAPRPVAEVAEGLLYRDFVIVGMLCRRLSVNGTEGGQARDTWIYIHEKDVLVGRLQIFNNWSPWLVRDASTFWVGMEYFCSETDDLWRRSDTEMIGLATSEIVQLGFAASGDILDATVIRMPKAYPAYFGTYDRFGEIVRYTDGFENLFLVGRNGMHRYNNQDHSMLASMMSVDNIINGVRSRDALWALNTEMEHHEEK